MSNWDLMAWDENGKSTDGSFIHNFTQIRIYKNWVYIGDEKAHNKYSAFTKPTIMSIQSGTINYNDCHIYAKRGKQDSIYVVVSSYVKNKNHYMYGIGCCAYVRNKCVGVTEETYQDFIKWLTKLKKEEYIRIQLPKKKMRCNQGDMIMGGFLEHSTLIGKSKGCLMERFLK